MAKKRRDYAQEIKDLIDEGVEKSGEDKEVFLNDIIDHCNEGIDEIETDGYYDDGEDRDDYDEEVYDDV